MSTRVIQLDIFQTGFRDDNDAPVIGGSVEFYTADQTYTTPKNAYTTKNKDATLTSVTLDSNGAYPNGLFFDGGTVYDFRLKDPVGATVRNYINSKIPNNTESVRTVTTDYTATIDDDVILCNTTSNAITITLYPVEDSVVSLTIKNIGSALNAVTIDGDGTDLINGSLTSSLVDGAAQQYFSDLSQWFGAATTTGTAYTSDNLVGGAGITFTAGGGQTSVAVDVTDSSIAASNTAKGVIEIATNAESVTGTSEVLAINPLQLKTDITTAVDALPFSEEYLSTGQTITTAGQLVLPHGLGVEPKLIEYKLQCTTAEFNYSIGDRITMVGNTTRNNLPVIDSTNITIRFTSLPNAFSGADKNTGASIAFTNSSWQLYVNAWA